MYLKSGSKILIFTMQVDHMVDLERAFIGIDVDFENMYQIY